jgi:D-alanyl-D-alanine carboxypeptidase/D-alanyl-D-alanine-endopeptidase (penicillin-binding protein 4)
MKSKILFSFLVVFLFVQNVFAQDMASKLDELINNNDLSKSSVVAVKIIDETTKTPYYQKNSSLLLHPASTMKVATSAVVLSTLGHDYKVKTSLFENDGNLFLKLSGDPTLTHNELCKLFKNVDLSKYNAIVVDNSAIDNVFYDAGWMWNNLISDDNVPYGIYNLDRNIIQIKIIPDRKTGMVQILSGYPVAFVNELTIGDANNIKIEKRPWLNPDAVYISGTVAAPCIENIAVQNPEIYFLHYLHLATKDFQGKTYYGAVPCGAKLLSEKQTPLMEILSEQNKRSNNLFAQTMFKIAAHEAYQTTGTFDNAMTLFNKFYNNNGLVISDASGLSHYNLLNCDFLCDALSKMSQDKYFRSTLAESGKVGTLHKRLPDVKIQGKTGTIAGVSGLCGYVKAKSGHEYIFAILVQNYKGKAKPAKELEDSIVRVVNEY